MPSQTFSPALLPAGFAKGHWLLPWDTLRAASPVAQGPLQRMEGTHGWHQDLGDCGCCQPAFSTQRFQSLTLTYPSAERIPMSARLINTSDFNLRSHGIALSSPRSQLGKQFCLQTRAASSPPAGPGHPLRLLQRPRRTRLRARGFWGGLFFLAWWWGKPPSALEYPRVPAAFPATDG